MDMVKLSMVTLVVAAGLAAAAPGSAEASHRRLGMHGWCRADAAQMMGVSRRAVLLDRHVLRTAGGRYEIRGLAAHGRYGSRAFICHFNARGVLQGAV
jgi:hypothetical protein